MSRHIKIEGSVNYQHSHRCIIFITSKLMILTGCEDTYQSALQSELYIACAKGSVIGVPEVQNIITKRRSVPAFPTRQLRSSRKTFVCLGLPTNVSSSLDLLANTWNLGLFAPRKRVVRANILGSDHPLDNGGAPNRSTTMSNGHVHSE